MKKIIEYTAYVSLTIAALTASSTLIHQQLRQRQPPISLSPLTLMNKQLPLSGVNWKAAHSTVVVAMTTVCHFCQDSLPFYKTLAKLEGAQPSQFQMIACPPEEIATTQKYLSENQTSFDQIQSAPYKVSMLLGHRQFFFSTQQELCARCTPVNFHLNSSRS